MLSIFLLVFLLCLCHCPSITFSVLLSTEKLPPLHVVASPVDPFIVEGHGGVTLHCNSSSIPSSVTWAWSRLTDQGGWQEVGTGRDLTLTKAEQSGIYHCRAIGIHQERSPNHTVNIISLPASGW